MLEAGPVICDPAVDRWPRGVIVLRWVIDLEKAADGYYGGDRDVVKWDFRTRMREEVAMQVADHTAVGWRVLAHDEFESFESEDFMWAGHRQKWRVILSPQSGPATLEEAQDIRYQEWRAMEYAGVIYQP